MEDVGELRIQMDELEEERRELQSRNQALKEDAKVAAVHGQDLLERCAQLKEENKQLGDELERCRRDHLDDSKSSTSRQSMYDEVCQLRQENFTQMQLVHELERDLGKRDELVRALEEEKRGMIEQLAEQRREESTLVQKLEKEKGGLAEKLEELSMQVRAQEKLIASLGQQLETAQEELEGQSGTLTSSWKTLMFKVNNVSTINPRGGRQQTSSIQHPARHSVGDAPGSAPVDGGFGGDSRELLETFADELRNISGSHQTLVGNMDAKIRDVQDRLESLSVTLHKPSMHTQATMDGLQMEDMGEILNTLQELQEQLVTVHASVGSLSTQSDTRAALGEVEGTIARNLQGFQEELRAKLEALQEQQDSSSRQLREKVEAFHEQHESLGGLIAQRALEGLSAERCDSGRGEAERLHQEVVRLCEQLAASLEGTRAGYEQQLARAVEGFRLEKESLGDTIAQRALDRLSAERLDSSGGQAERLQQEVTRLRGKLAAQQKAAEDFQQEKAGLLQLLGSALEACPRAPQGAAESPRASEELEREAQRLRIELASAEQRVRDGQQDRQRLSRAVEGARRDMAGLQAELERLRAAPEEVARLRRELAEEREAQKRIQRQADTDIVRSLVALRDLDANLFSPTR